MHLLALSDYVQTKNRWCGPWDESGKYNNLVDAENACNQNKACKAFYDIRSQNDSFVLCGPPHLIKRSAYLRSTLYTKCKFSIESFFCSLKKNSCVHFITYNRYTTISLNFSRRWDHFGTTNWKTMLLSIFVQGHQIQWLHHGGFFWSTLVFLRRRVFSY